MANTGSLAYIKAQVCGTNVQRQSWTKMIHWFVMLRSLARIATLCVWVCVMIMTTQTSVYFPVYPALPPSPYLVCLNVMIMTTHTSIFFLFILPFLSPCPSCNCMEEDAKATPCWRQIQLKTRCKGHTLLETDTAQDKAQTKHNGPLEDNALPGSTIPCVAYHKGSEWSPLSLSAEGYIMQAWVCLGRVNW